MKRQYLEVTFRRGKPFAAYLYLPRKVGVKAARTEDRGRGLLIDFDESNTPIGIEITAPSAVTIVDVNGLLTAVGIASLPAEDLAPLRAA
jgi:uncharacterized protein YuzE